MNDLSPKRQDKFRAYRARKKARGFREVRMWIPDWGSPGFWERSAREAALLRKSAGEEETMAFVEALQASDRGLWD